jgi:hypothetical protein
MKEIVAGILIWFLAVFIMLGINVMSTEMENNIHIEKNYDSF